MKSTMKGDREMQTNEATRIQGEAMSSQDQPQRKSCGYASEGVQSAFDRLAKKVFGSCGNVVEAASFLVQNSWSRNAESTEMEEPKTRATSHPLAGLAGRYKSKSLNPRDGCHHSEIPSFLQGEPNGNSFDDNISALSAHTLEEMAKSGQVLLQPQRNQPGASRYRNVPPPPPMRTSSSSSSSQEQSLYDMMKAENSVLKGYKKSTKGDDWQAFHIPSEAREKIAVINVKSLY